MNKKLIIAALALITLASCTDNEFIGDTNLATDAAQTEPISFGFNVQNTTRAGELIGATAAEKLGGMFVVEGTKGSEQTTSPSTDVVFDNYLVGYTANTAGVTTSNTHNWEYVGKQDGITGRMTAATWNKLHETGAKVQSIKYWDYSVDQYDFIAWSTGKLLAIPTPTTPAVPTAGEVQVTRINTGATLASNGFSLRAASAADLLQCYYTDINTVTKTNYNKPVVLTFRNMAAKVRLALYETVPGYSVKNVKFYQEEASTPTAPNDLGSGTVDDATLFTLGTDKIAQSGSVLVYYPHIGTNHRGTTGDATYPNPAKDYNKASVTVTADPSTETVQEFGTLTAQYVPAEAYEGAKETIPASTTLSEEQAAAVNAALSTSYTAGQAISEAHANSYNAKISLYLGRTASTATYAGAKGDDYYVAVVPNTDGMPLTLRVDYTLVSTDGSGEEINVYGAKAVVPATYTVWQPNYAYTYVFKISDNSNGWTDTDATKAGLFPITFDAVVTSFVDYNAEQRTITTVAIPSITTYQQGHDKATNEYNKKQESGSPASVKGIYVQVMDNSGDGAPTLITDLNGTDKSLLYEVSSDNASEAQVMDVLQNRVNTPTGTPTAAYKATDPKGRNGITLTKNNNINNEVTQIVNGVDDQPITKIDGSNIVAGQVAKIDITALSAGTYAYVYAKKVPTTEEKIYHVAANVTDNTSAQNYYEVVLAGDGSDAVKPADAKATAGNVYFVINKDAEGKFVSYTFKQTKVGDDVEGLVEKEIPVNKANTYTEGNFYFDVYYQNDGVYAVKVIKVVDVEP